MGADTLTSSTTDHTGSTAPGHSGPAGEECDIERLAIQAQAAVVDAMLAAAGLSPEATEREELIATYTMFKPSVESLYAVPEARYEAPALVFQAAPKLAPWRK
jgi:hypothetical protein